MKILSIGNSFSCDAQRYFQRIAKKAGETVKTVNLFIGGCSLRTHYLNILQDSAAYVLGFNGEETGFKVSISQALASDDWDVVTLQQASQFSPDFETYSTYLENLASYVRKYCPKAKIYMHQTWAYEEGSERLNKVGYESTEAMLSDIEASYEKAAGRIKADGVIPCGRAMFNATKLGIEKIHRDTFHAALGVGRYLLGLTWCKALLGMDITDNDYDEFDVPVSEEERAIAIKAVNATFDNYKGKKFAGKTFLFLGDSITEGVHGPSMKSNRYTDVFAKISGATTYTYGIGGTRIAYQINPTVSNPRHDMYFASRVRDMRGEADYVVVFGGHNDMGNGDAPLGKFGDTTPTTFYGALHDLFTKLRAKYPKTKIITITPLDLFAEFKYLNAVGAERPGGMKAYADAIKEMAERFQFPVLDANSEWEITTRDEVLKEKYISADGLHPNDIGHRYIAEKFLEFMENL
ncbi:MAG: SGNH/GDSL hydrolase family protein [Clostridia bacterium]|nr:SGNH/GDSL hydrolase family protein [Clostridia bacterium]